MTPDALRLVGAALFGAACWQSELARALDTRQDTVNNWAKGRRTMPAWLPGELLRLIAARHDGLHEAAATIHAGRLLALAADLEAQHGTRPAAIDLRCRPEIPAAVVPRIVARLEEAGFPVNVIR